MSQNEIFISYAWRGESEALVDQLVAELVNRGYVVRRDKTTMIYKDSIKSFMDRIGQGKFVIAVINDQYMKSEYCMYEAYRMFQSPAFRDRVFPIVLPDADVFSFRGQVAYLKYWGAEYKQLQEEFSEIASLAPTMVAKLTERLRDIETTTRFINDFMAEVGDMNTLTSEMHLESGFDELIGAIEMRMRILENETGNRPAQDEREQGVKDQQTGAGQAVLEAIKPDAQVQEKVSEFPEKDGQSFVPEMVHIPAGSFMMGSTEAQVASVSPVEVDLEWAKRELPQHKVHLPDYFIGKYPITNAQYRVFVEATGYKAPDHWKDNLPPADKSDHPVVNVSWHDAIFYCRWLKQNTGDPYTLPSEAEWEKAARGSTDARIYPWGEVFEKVRCNTQEAGIGDTTPVGQFSPQGDSPYGCADMSGNVWEWTRSKWGEEMFKEPEFRYPYDPDDGREDLEGRATRVLRGGPFNFNLYSARVSDRYGNYPDLYWINYGFRVALPARLSTA